MITKKRVVKRKRRENVFETDVVLELLESLPRVIATTDGPYTHTDRARDFLGCFGDERGRRVLSQISHICDPPIHPSEADKHGTLAFKAGMRRVLAEIMVCMSVREPITIQNKGDSQ